jgi:type IV pilus assembly protein PilX
MKSVSRKHAQKGAVLIVALLFLVVLTMLGVTAMTGTTFEERMAGNARDAAVAIHSAEASLRAARDVVLGLRGAQGLSVLQTGTGPNEANFADTSNAAGVCVKGLCSPRTYAKDLGVVPPEIPAGVNWAEDDGAQATTDAYAPKSGPNNLLGVSKQSRFIVELFCLPLVGGDIDGQASTCRVWRFTAVGWGKNPNTQVTVQETYISEKRK